MGSSGGGQEGKGGKISTMDWILNPIGSGGKRLLGFDIDPIGSVIAGASKYVFDIDDARKEKNYFGSGGFGLHDMANQDMGGTSAIERERANRSDWQNYYASQGKDKWGKTKKTPEKEETSKPDTTIRKKATTTEEEGESLLG